MRSWGPVRRCLAGGAITALVVALAADAAVAGEYTVGNCRSDKLNFNTRAFDTFLKGRMKVRRACNPVGSGLRALITQNVVSRGKVPRGAVAGVLMTAPPGTQFTSFRWGGKLRRADCRYAIQLWAEDPNDSQVRFPIRNLRANRNCSNRRPARRPIRSDVPQRLADGGPSPETYWPETRQVAGYGAREYRIPGATRIVQRVICLGDDEHKECSSRGVNYQSTYEAQARIEDVTPPAAMIFGDTPLARGEWVGGIQPLNYDASDNVGVRLASANASGQRGGSDQRPCSFAVPEEVFADRVPCPNGFGQIGVNTKSFVEGTQALTVQAQDTAGNVRDSPPVTARINNTTPARVDILPEGGEDCRNRNEFAVSYANPAEADRAPIAAASYRLCPVNTGSCNRAEQAGADITRVGLQVPAAGEWTLSVWRRDAAGNENEQTASVPVALRYDPEPPRLAFEPTSAADPTLIMVPVTDQVSGLAGGAIEISASGSGTWQSLPTEMVGERLVARID